MNISKKQCCNGYQPAPIDTSDVIIPEALRALVDALAKNTHEVWSASKIAEGWDYGENLNQTLKTHPDLIPYEQLTEGEKAYDINTTQEIIKVLLKLGYTISAR